MTPVLRLLERSGLFGPERPVVQKRSAGGRWFLHIALAPIALALVAFVLVATVDPFDLRPWGVRTRLPEASPAMRIAPRLVNLVAASDIDTLVVGGSTLQVISPALMKEAFGATGRPFNIAYDGPMPGDQKWVLDKVLTMPRLRRVVVGLDFTYLLPAGETSRHFPMRLYERPWFDLGSDFDRTGVEMALRRLFARPEAAFPRHVERRRPVTARPEIMTLYADAIRVHRPQVDAPSGSDCGSLPALARVLVPFAAAATGKGIVVDVVIPPYAAVAYYHWLHRPPPRYLLRRPAAVLDQWMSLRRCAARALAAVPGVSLHAFDNEDWITGRLENYADSTHLISEAAVRFMLGAIVARSHLLTPENVESDIASLRSRVKQYETGRGGS